MVQGESRFIWKPRHRPGLSSKPHGSTKSPCLFSGDEEAGVLPFPTQVHHFLELLYCICFFARSNLCSVPPSLQKKKKGVVQGQKRLNLGPLPLRSPVPAGGRQKSRAVTSPAGSFYMIIGLTGRTAWEQAVETRPVQPSPGTPDNQWETAEHIPGASGRIQRQLEAEPEW